MSATTCHHGQTIREKEIIHVPMEKLNWPKKVDGCFSTEILRWLASEDLSPAAIEAVARESRVHVIPQSRATNGAYLVVGGFFDFVLLMKAGWGGKVTCIFDPSIKAKDIRKLLYMDICNDFFCFKAGPVATAAKAALLIELLELGEKAGEPSCLNLSARHLATGTHLLKKIVGFDPRSYRRVNKKGMDPEVRTRIETILGMSSDNISASQKTTIGADNESAE